MTHASMDEHAVERFFNKEWIQTFGKGGPLFVDLLIHRFFLFLMEITTLIYPILFL